MCRCIKFIKLLKNLQNKIPNIKSQASYQTMQNAENYIEIQVHNTIMQNLRQRELQYKNKIIQLEKQKEYESNRANQFQQRFRQALLTHGDQVDLIEKLSSKENQNNHLRMEIIKLKKNIDNINQSTSPSKAYNQLTQTNKQLINQNQQMAKTIEELKNAAISAIMAKDDQIEELNEKIAKAQDLAQLYQTLLEREENLQKEIEKMRAQAEEEQKALSQKLAKQREKYLQKLQEFQHSLHNEQSSKQELLQKAELLQNNLENKEQIIYLYQNKLNEFEGVMKHQKSIFQQQKQKFAIEIDNLKDKLSLYEKEVSNLQKVVSEYNFKQKESKILSQRLKDENSQLQRKLLIKKRKNNSKMKSSDIYSSFEGISQKSSFYSSFYKPRQQVKPTTLGEIQQLEQNDVLDSFIDLEGRGNDEEEAPNLSKKSEKIREVDLSQCQAQARISEPQDETKTQGQTQLQPGVNNGKHSQSQSLKKILLDNQNELRNLKEINQSLNKNLEESYSQIQRLTQQILTKTTQIQTERQNLAQLRSQNKKSQSEKQLIVELENFKQHVFKLQNALLIEKLQNAEKQEFMKQRTERQRKLYDQKINKLGQQIKELSPKKKKGFFR